ncbi:MAG: hypothetical protein AB1646_24005 [Thermodesulfobacteriota bacterium]
MRKTLLTLGFMLLFWSIPAALMVVDPCLRYCRTDYGKYLWIGRELAQSPKEYAYVFVGSSHMLHAIDAATVGTDLAGSPDAAINAATSWLGRDTSCLVARDFVKHHRVRNLVVECTLQEYAGSHQFFSFLCLPEDVIRHAYARKLFRAEAWIGNGDYREATRFILTNLASVGLRGYLRLRCRRDCCEGARTESEYSQHRGFVPFDGEKDQVSAWRARQASYDSPPIRHDWDPETVPEGKRTTIWHNELTRLAAEARKQDTRLILLCVPERLNLLSSEGYLRYLSRLGQVMPFPREILADPNLWRDEAHLNVEGARRFTDYFVASELCRIKSSEGCALGLRSRGKINPATTMLREP